MIRSVMSLIACVALVGASMLCAASPAAAATTAEALSQLPQMSVGEIVAASGILAVAMGVAAVGDQAEAAPDAFADVDRPSMGRVIFVKSRDGSRSYNGATEFPAIVLQSWPDHMANVKVLAWGCEPFDVGSVRHENDPLLQTTEGGFSWRWPPRV